MGTPNAVWHTIERCWEIEPTSQRILEDIKALPEVLHKIIDAKGCVVQDLYLRSGRRYHRANDNGDCKQKPRKRDLKQTLEEPVCHQDCADARDMLRNMNFALDNKINPLNVANSCKMEESSDNEELP